ncbi:Uncharacterised protein [Bordetella pertussis]|nr:Uncharacterised protein [Bordetella pertussis]
MQDRPLRRSVFLGAFAAGCACPRWDRHTLLRHDMRASTGNPAFLIRSDTKYLSATLARWKLNRGSCA